MEGTPHVYWVIDTGVTHHITSNLSNFSSYSSISPHHMKLPNDIIITTTIDGTMHLSPALVLTHVYYILTFNVNLILVTKFIDSSASQLTFTNTQCFILQKSSKTLIGLAERHGDLYIFIAHAPPPFSSTLSACNSVFNTPSIIWHRIH